MADTQFKYKAVIMATGSTCAVCGKKVKSTEKGICCDGPCDRWFHAKCKNLSDDRYKLLASDNKLQWTCDRDDCVETPNLSQIDASINKLIKKLMRWMVRTEKSVSRCNSSPTLSTLGRRKWMTSNALGVSSQP